MRHQISVPIEGDLFLDPHGDQTLTASRDGVQFALVPDSHNHIVRATAMCSVPPGRTTKAVSDRLVEALKALYAHLSFSRGQGAVFAMDFDNIEHLPVADGDEDIGNVASYRLQREYPAEAEQLDGDAFRRLIHNMPRYESLTAAKELFRRGLVFYRNHAYFCAFVHFIFIVESFYADGKTGKAAVITAFKKSAEFGRIIGYVLTEMPSKATGRGVMQLVKKAGCQWTTDGIMEFLYDERGRLLHYFKATNQFNPFTEDEHQPVAFLAMSVGCHAILQKTVAINQTNPAQPENQVTAAPGPPTAAPPRHAQPRRSGIEYHRVVLRERVSPSRVAELIHDWRPYNKEKSADSYGYVGSVLDYPESDDNIALAIVPSATADRTRHPVLQLFCKVGDARYMRSVSTLDHAQVSFPNDGRLFVFKTGSNEIIVSSELLSEKVVMDFLRFGCNFARQTRVGGDDRGGRRLADSH